MGAITGVAMGIGAAASAASAVSGIAASRRASKQQGQMMAAAQEGGAFDPLLMPKPQRLDVPGAGAIMGQWRGDVLQNYGGYEDIAQRYLGSEQTANRQANLEANPQYYNVLQQLTDTAQQAGKGVLPDDVKQQILQNANEDSYLRGFSYGKPGGGGNVYAGGNDASANLALRNLGLSSLDMMKYGNQLAQDVLGQSRSSRGRVVSTMDVTPTPGLFQQQMNNQAIADYNYRTDKEAYRVGGPNAAQQAAMNKLTFQTGANTNQAMLGQSSNRMALESLTALGNLYGNISSTGAGSTSILGGFKNLFGKQTDFGQPLPGFGTTAQPMSQAPTIRAGSRF